MRRLLLTLVLLALVVSVHPVMADGPFSAAFQQQWKAVQAQERQNAAALSRVEREAARIISGTPAPAGDEAVAPPSKSGDRMICLNCEPMAN